MPKVSVLCSAYNQRHFVEQTIEGILAQRTTFSVELIINDDASTDGTRDVVRSYEERDERVKVIYQKENQFSRGYTPRDFLLPASSGDYLAWCEGDDVWTDPYKLQKQVDYLDQNIDDVGCYTDYTLIDLKGNPKPSRDRSGSRESYSHLDVLQKGCPKLLTLMLRRQSLIELIKRLSSYSGLKNGDQLFCAFATQHGSIAYLPGVTGAYRVGSGFWSTMAMCAQSRNIVDSFLSMAEYFNSIEQREAIAKRVVRRLAVVGQSKEEDDKQWFDSIESRMAELGLAFDRSLYNRAIKEYRRKQLRRKFRALFKVGK